MPFFVLVIVACRCSALAAAAALSVKGCFDDAPQALFTGHTCICIGKSWLLLQEEAHVMPTYGGSSYFAATVHSFHNPLSPSWFLLSRHRTQLLGIVFLPFAIFHTIPNVFTTATSLPDKDYVTKHILTLKWLCWTETSRSFRHN